MTTISFDTTTLLKQVLARDPDASLDKIRRAHPALGAMSPDHLCLRLSRLIEGRRDASAK